MASLTDNMVKYSSKNLSLDGTTLVTDEIELDIPRGYIAKLHKIMLEVVNLSVDIIDQTADVDVQISAGLVRDPDDQSSLAPPDNDVNHDVLWRLFADLAINVTEGSSVLSGQRNDSGWIPKELDMITARNLRLNADVFGTSAAIAVDASIRCDIYFTYEKVTKGDILQLLEIV